MKRLCGIFLSCLLFILPIYADGVEVNGIHYLFQDNGTAWVTCKAPRGNYSQQQITLPVMVKYGNKSYKVVAIDEDAFTGCKNLESIVIPSGVEEIRDYAFNKCSKLQSVTIPQTVKKIGWKAFSGCKKLGAIILPSELEFLGKSAFSNCSSLKAIILPNGIKKIRPNTFEDCVNLSDVQFPANVRRIQKGAFSGCRMARFALPSKLQRIEDNAFDYCSYIEEVILPPNLNYIGNRAFMCKKLERVECKALVPPECHSNAFTGNESNYILVVPAQALKAYKSAPVWSNFGEIKAKK